MDTEGDPAPAMQELDNFGEAAEAWQWDGKRNTMWDTPVNLEHNAITYLHRKQLHSDTAEGVLEPLPCDDLRLAPLGHFKAWSWWNQIDCAADTKFTLYIFENAGAALEVRSVYMSD
jgi:hypothetical protein